MTGTGDTIKVYIQDCAVPLFVGIYDHEKPQAQPVIVHVEATAALTRRYDHLTSDALSAVIDYERLYTFITQGLPKLGHVPLLESLAEHIVSFCFEDPRIEAVTVRLDKPEAFKGKALAGITLRRTRRAS